MSGTTPRTWASTRVADRLLAGRRRAAVRGEPVAPGDARPRRARPRSWGCPSHALFEFHLSSWVSDDNSGPATLPEINRIKGMPVLCIFGADETTPCARSWIRKNSAMVKLKGGHHFDGDYAKLARQILAAAGRITQIGGIRITPSPIRSTHGARQVLASNECTKYCVSRATLSPLNSMMLTVQEGFPSYVRIYSVIQRSPLPTTRRTAKRLFSAAWCA